MEYIWSFIRAIGLFVIGLASFRIMGSQTVGRLTNFDLVVVIAIGAIIGDGLANPELDFMVLTVAIAGLVLMQLTASILAMRSTTIEKLVIGSPIQLVKQGKLLMSGLRRARITRNNLEQELRVKGLTTLETIESAYMEPNGKLSVIETDEKS